MSNTAQSSNCQLILTNLQTILQPFWREVETRQREGQATLSLALNPIQLALFSAMYTPTPPTKILVLPPDFEDPNGLHQQIELWNAIQGVKEHWHLITDDLTEQERAGIVHTALSDAYRQLLSMTLTHHFIITSSALSISPPSQADYQDRQLRLTQGETVRLHDLAAELVERGYVRHTAALEKGSFRIQGEHVEIQPPASEVSYAITFHGSTVERIAAHVNRRSKPVTTAVLPPVTFPAATSSWTELVQPHTVIRPTAFQLNGAHTIILTPTQPDLPFPLQAPQTDTETSPPHTMYMLYVNKDRTDAYIREHYPTATVHACEHALGRYPIALRAADVEFKTEAAVFPPNETSPRSSISYERALELIAELEVGKPAVHSDHGVGIYEGLQRQVTDGATKEYLALRYAEGDALYVPVEYAHKVTPYVGSHSPAIHRLGGTLWQKTKKKAKADAVAFAAELLTISRKRDKAERSAYVIAPDVETQLHHTFPHTLTPDQVRTWEEIIEDLQKNKPMDRLIVGDVGFGKTELAIRAARHAVANNKQVAVLAPTTLLVQQHIDTFKQRLADIQSSLYVLSRFVSAAERKEAQAAAASGKATIVIGTHALLGSAMQWHNLGLVIIDEEQKFGVKQKEHFKDIRAQVDVLSLSATSIPRTLSMALSGLRALSVIATAPEGRKHSQTYVKKVDPTLIQSVIERELQRRGQVYVVAPKIRQLGAIHEEIKALVPHARTAIAHAQLSDEALSRIIHDFDQGNIDVLISSSIVENGLDLPNVNTMIVWNAQHFGLAELYQLRGRIGRRQRQGYAYFLYNQDKLTALQRERLTALTEASRLGSGWELARRDLEMRGAGNLLGADQSGSMNSVGAQLYLDLVRQAIGEESRSDTDIQLPITALIPTHYIKEDRERSRWYIRITRSSPTTQAQYQEELQRMYGPYPAEVKHLFQLVTLQRVAGGAGITKIRHQIITPADEEAYDRLIIEGSRLPDVIQKLGEMGRWVGRGNAITLDMNAITPATVQTLIEKLV